MPPKLCPDFTCIVSHCQGKSWLALLAGRWCVASFAQFSPRPISTKLNTSAELGVGCAGGE